MLAPRRSSFSAASTLLRCLHDDFDAALLGCPPDEIGSQRLLRFESAFNLCDSAHRFHKRRRLLTNQLLLLFDGFHEYGGHAGVIEGLVALRVCSDQFRTDSL